MASDDWRLRIELEHEEKRGLLDRLGLRESDAEELAAELRDLKLVVTEEDGTLHVYAGSSLDLERARTLIEREFDELGLHAESMTTEHWLADEERWDGAEPSQDYDDELVSEGFAPWEVRIPARDHKAAVELADRLEAEGYGVIRRWSFVIAGCADEEQARALAARLHGEVEAGGEMVYESMPQNPFRFFGGLADV
jgi:hypothetical protein